MKIINKTTAKDVYATNYFYLPKHDLICFIFGLLMKEQKFPVDPRSYDQLHLGISMTTAKDVYATNCFLKSRAELMLVPDISMQSN